MSEDGITFERVRERAHEIWERNHRPEGFEVEFWLMAERELRAEQARRKPAADRTASETPPGADTTAR
jgi:hypothetical protein